MERRSAGTSSLNDDKSPLIDLISCIVCKKTMKLREMRPRAEGAWSYKEDRRLLELAKPKEIPNLMNRSPNAIRKMAIRLGVSLNNNRLKSGPIQGLKGVRKAASARGRSESGNETVGRQPWLDA